MNSLRTPRNPRQAVRQGPVHVSVVVARLLAMYGITEESSSAPSKPSAPPPRELVSACPPVTAELIKPNQQTFSWFTPAESHA